MYDTLWDEDEFRKILTGIPGVGRILEARGRQTLAEYVPSIVRHTRQPLQDRSDLIEAGAEYVRPLLGSSMAARLAGRLERTPVFLTANHLGVDFHPFVFQGNLLFGWALGNAGTACREDLPVLPVMSFGSVSLGNQVYTRGIILSRETDTETDAGLQPRSVRIGVLPAGLRRTAACFAPPFTAAMIKSALVKVNRLHRDRVIGSTERDVLTGLLEDEYLQPDVLEKETYGRQAAMLNHALWPRIFNEKFRAGLPDLVMLEIETIVTRLLEKDLFNRDSLVYRVLFEEDLRTAVLSNLEAVFGCWDRCRLNRALDENLAGNRREKALSKSGTGFFWGVSRRGRLVRLAWTREDGRDYLAGRDEYGTVHRVDFTPDGLARGLLEGRLLPGLFVTFLEVAFARGFRCLGGFFQAEYLPLMQQGLSAALKGIGQRTWADQVEAVPSTDYITGMVVALAQYGDQLKPAGMVEVMCGGGLSPEEWSSIGDMTVAEANLFGLIEIYRDFAGQSEAVASSLNLTDPGRMNLIAEKMIRIRL